MMLRGVENQRKHYHYNTQDPDKPNFIFSSDIVEKVEHLCHEYLSIRDKQCYQSRYDDDDEVISLGTKDIEFAINIELNTLLLYNHSLKPSDLIQDNLVCLAKADHIDSEVARGGNLIFKNTNASYKGIQPYVLKSKEIFIINITLKLLTFNVFHQVSPIIIDFIKDENYAILLLCNSILLSQIESYIKVKFIKEVNKTLITPITIPSNSTDDYPTPQEISKLSSDILLNDSTLEGSESESVAGKTFLYDDDDDDHDDEQEVDEELQDLLLLNSNDTIRYSSSDDYDDVGFSLKTSSKLLPKTTLSTIKEEKKSDSFIENLNNLRHNDLNDIDNVDYVDIDDESEDDEDDEIHTDHILHDLHQLRPPIQLRIPNHDQNSTQIDTTTSNDILSPPMTPAKTLTRQSSYLSYLSPKKETTTKSVSRMTSTASLSFINNDDASGLEYAYRDKSPTVPSYIKEDKKFRFIKVGKVQKFVDLFEEKMGDKAPELAPPPPIFRSNSKQVSPGLE